MCITCLVSLIPTWGVGGVFFRGDQTDISTEYTSFWAQDTISAGSFTVNVGFRYDLQDGTNEAVTQAANPAFPNLLPALNLATEDVPFEWESITPRVGVTYALGAERKTLLRASFSQFPEQLSTGDVFRLNQVDANFLSVFWDDENENRRFEEGEFLLTNPEFGGATPNAVDPNLDPAITNEMILGVEHALLPEFVVGASYTWRRLFGINEKRAFVVDPFSDLPARVATANDYIPDGEVTGTLPDGGGFRVPTFALRDPLLFNDGLFLTDGDREREYQGVGVTFTKRLANQWMLRGYFNVGEAEWDIPTRFFQFQDPTDIVGSEHDDGASFAPQSSGSEKEDVFLHSNWQFNLNGMYQVAPDRPWGFNVAANLFGREGYPLPYFQRVEGSDGEDRDVQVTTEVDQFRTDDILTVDLRLEKEFAATGDVTFTVGVDAFNLLDEAYVLQRERRLNSTRTDFLRETLSPRVWRLGVRLNWR